MNGVVEQYAASLGWSLARNNVIVEGTSDVEYLTCASNLYEHKQGRPLLDNDLAIVAAGQGDDGGVDGVNRRLSFFRQLADGDRDETGVLRHRFFGLFDKDTAGKGAFIVASRFDRRIEPYADVFLLHPIMPVFTLGYDRAMEINKVNRPFNNIDWEIEDLCSDRIWTIFESEYTDGVLSKIEAGGLKHRELRPNRKPELKRIFTEQAKLADAAGFIELLRMLRIYLGLQHNFILR
ncbi:conserved hypothetical protein [Agrobacterium fabacearum CFBP 5771]|uniref:hypothetical protein n=1 Tax=Agrobacterium tumefaciens TaxID=358 RepID=UPI0009BBD251|nr:hypothetical protein [Agrobacterium tumefaciens]CVI20288.1 conserved hypothetical protein [Agrobacterium fabacearum CFBP 5771]